MPTRRTWIFLTIAIILYLLANQTQVGWIYVIAGGIMGLLSVSFLYERKRLAALSVSRTFQALPKSGQQSGGENSNLSNGRQIDPAITAPSALILPVFHEDDPIEITLHFENDDIRPAFLIGGQETCPFAPALERNQPFFVPTLFKHQPVILRYQTTCDRRGLFTFSALPLQSQGLFGFFKTRRTLTTPSDILIYPQYYPLKRLKILEKRQAGQRETVKVGAGSQVIGTREYRPGDSLRQVHWRSTARRGAVVVKEFADEDQLSLTVVLDLYSGPSLDHGVGQRRHHSNGNKNSTPPQSSPTSGREPTKSNRALPPRGRGVEGGIYKEIDKYAPFESAIRLAATFGYYATQKHLPFYVLGTGQKGRAPRMALSWSALLNYLAKVENNGQTPLSQLLETIPASPFLIVLVSRPTPEIAAALANISPKHTQTLAIFITPDGTLADHLQPSPAPRLTSRVVAAARWQEGLETL